MENITHIFYDLDGTLRLSVPNGYRAFADGVELLGIALSAEDRQRTALWEHSYWAESPDLRQDAEKFPEEDAFWLNYSHRQLRVLVADDERAAALAPAMHQYMAEHYRPADVIPADLTPTLTELKKRGYQLGVMSNREHSYATYLAERGLDEFFPNPICAPESGVRKPSPGAFHYMLEKAGARAENSIYIGDNYFADVVGARRAGLQPVLFDVNSLFHEPDCLVITQHSQIFDLLG